MQCMSIESDPLVRQIKRTVKGLDYPSTYKFEPTGIILSKSFVEMSQKIKSMTVRPDDIWIVTFPKTGTTVIQEATWLLKNNLDFEKAKEVLLTFRVPFLEARAIDLPSKTHPSVEDFENLPSPRIIKTHLPLSLLPDALWTVKPKVIGSYRTPKDVVISYYHHTRLIYGNEGTFEEFVELFLNDKYQFCPFWPFILEIWRKRNESNVHLISFKDISQNPAKFLRQLTEFLGVPLSDQGEGALLDHLSLGKMRSNPSINYEALIRTRSKEEGNFVRSGKVDEWREKMPPEMVKRFDNWSARFLKNTDFPFYY